MYDKTDTATQQNSPISEAINDAFGALSALEGNVAILDNRLAPVLREVAESPGEDCTGLGPSCALEEEIRHITRRIRGINNFVVGLDRRVAL